MRGTADLCSYSLLAAKRPSRSIVGVVAEPLDDGPSYLRSIRGRLANLDALLAKSRPTNTAREAETRPVYRTQLAARDSGSLAVPQNGASSGGNNRNLITEGVAAVPFPYDPAQDTNPPADTNSYDQAWERLISCVVPQNELAPLLETVFSDEKVHDVVDRLQGDKVQTFIDVIDAVRHHALPPPKDRSIDHRFNFLHSVG